MYKLKFNLFVLSFFLVYTQGLWERLLIVTDAVKYLIDVVIILAIVINFKFTIKTPAAKVFFAFVFLSVITAYGNTSSIVDLILYLRFIVYSYLIFQQFYNSNLSDTQYKILSRVILFSVIIQGLGSAFNVFVLGLRQEGHVGLMSSLGGTTATAYPTLIVALSTFCLLLSKRFNRKQVIYCLLIYSSAFLVAFSSGKRGVFFLIPFIVLAVVFLSRKYLKRSRLKQLLLAFVLFIPVFFFGVINSRGFNYNLRGNETYSQLISKMITYSEEYESAEAGGMSIGRSNTTINALEASLKDIEAFTVGYGFKKLKNETFLKSVKIGYGIVGFSNMLLSGGWIFCMLYVFFVWRLFFGSTNKDILTSIVNKVFLVVFLLIHFFYSADFISSLKITLLGMTILALINSPSHKNYKYQFFKNINIL